MRQRVTTLGSSCGKALLMVNCMSGIAPRS
jgi:hypothetical protein